LTGNFSQKQLCLLALASRLSLNWRAQVAAVGNITVYVRRYYVQNDVRRILTVVPGLEAKMASNDNDQPDDLPKAVVGVEVDDRTARPTASTSNAIY